MLTVEKQAFKKYLQEELGAYPKLSFPVKNYLVEMLSSYLNSDTFFEKTEGQNRAYEYCLVDLYKKSQISGFQEKLYIFKKIGDLSLYFCGFFRLAAQKKLVHVSYYEQMGQSAYHFISKNYESKSNVFTELASEFKNLSQILFSLNKKSEKKNSQNLLKLYKKRT